MRLKFKPIGLSAGRPIAFLNGEFAKRLGFFEGERIEVHENHSKLILPIDVVDKILKENEISFSDEAISFLKLRRGKEIHISVAPSPASTKTILKKLQGSALSREEIFEVVRDIVDNALNEPEIAYFVSGVYHNGMTFKETLALTEAIAHTGKILRWEKSRTIVDKHSIGGVPNNRTTPIVVSICAAAGLTLPKTSSRAITSAAGTADVMETITNVCLSSEKLQKVVEKTGACLAWGGSLGLAPADDKLIRVERLLNVDPEAQLLASIVAKKLSVGSKYVLIDIPFGDGAKVSREKGIHLKKEFEKIGKAFGMNIHVILTDGKQLIGNGVGPMLEMQDVLRVLKRDNSPRDLEKKAVFLAGMLLEITKTVERGTGSVMAQEILDSGSAYKKFEEIISAQGKKRFVVKLPKLQHVVRAVRNGKIARMDNKNINGVAHILGCPENKSSGLYITKHIGDSVKKGEIVATLYSDLRQKLEEAKEFLKTAQIFELK